MEQAGTTNWGPGLTVLGAAALIAVVFLLLSRRTKVGEVHAGTVDDLNARYNRLLGELKELHANKHLQPADAWEKDKVRLEQAAAAVLRERDGVKHETIKAQAREEKKVVVQAKETGLLAQNPALKGALIGGLVVGFFVFLAMQLSDSTKTRGEGQSITGGNMNAEGMGSMGGPSGQQGQPGQQEEDPEIKVRLDAVTKSPDNVDALTEAGMYLISVQAFQEAAPYIKRALGIDPFDVRARVGMAVLEAVEGQTKPAVEKLQHLANTYPEAYEARLYAGLILREEKNLAGALKEFETFSVQAPPAEQLPIVAQLIAELKNPQAAPSPSPQQMPPNHP